jgi:hypothetical protein
MAFRASFPAQRKLGRAILPLRNYDQCAVAESTHAHDVLGVEAILESPQIGSLDRARPSPQWPDSSFVLIDAAGRRSVAGPHRTRRFIRPGRGTISAARRTLTLPTKKSSPAQLS